MSIAFGVVLSILTAGTATWAAAGHRLAALPGVARVLDYVDGGYNLPSEAEVTAAPLKTLRGAYRQAVPDGWIFADEDPAAHAKSAVGFLIRDRGLPFPSREQHDADAARNGWGAP